MRRLVVNAVLSTDMTQHFKLVEAFTKQQAVQPELAQWDDVDLILQMVLHAADLSNPCRQLQHSIHWGELICCEFLEQVRSWGKRQPSHTWHCFVNLWAGLQCSMFRTVSYQQHPCGACLQHSTHLEAHLLQVPLAGRAAAWGLSAVVVSDVWVYALFSGW